MAQTVALVQERVRTKSVQSWLSLLRQANIPCAPVHTLDQALDHPQVKSRGLVAVAEHPLLGSIQQVGIPIKFNGEDRSMSRPPPLLGEHTDAVLKEIGYMEAQIATMKQAGVVA